MAERYKEPAALVEAIDTATTFVNENPNIALRAGTANAHCSARLAAREVGNCDAERDRRAAITKVPMRNFGRLGRIFALSLSGEAAQSAFHFALNLLLIKILSVYDYGVFALVFVLGALAVKYGDALIGIPAAVRLSGLTTRASITWQQVMYGSVALLLSSVVTVAVSIGLVLSVNKVHESIAAGMFVGLWMLRNYVRTVLLARRLTSATVASDFGYGIAGVLLTALAVLIPHDGGHLSGVLWALAIANAAAITIAMRGAHGSTRVGFRRTMWQRYRAEWRSTVWSATAVTAYNVQGQSLTFLVAAMAGPAAYAPIAAGILLFAPLRPAVSAYINVFRAEFVVALSEGRFRDVSRTIRAATGLVLLGCLAFGVLIWTTWPLLVAHVFAGKFTSGDMAVIVSLLGTAAAIFFTYNIALVLIQATGHFKPIAIATGLGGFTSICAVTVLLNVTTVSWSVAGMGLGEAVCGIYLWLTTVRILRQQTGRAGQSVTVSGDGPNHPAGEAPFAARLPV